MTLIAEIIFEEVLGVQGNVGLITLNRQEVLNALNHVMFLALDEHLIKWAEDERIKAVIIRAAKGRAFCAGGDIRHAYERAKVQDPDLPHFFYDEYQLNRRIHYFPKPYIALLDGITMGGGVGISIHGSHRVATENLTFAMPETTIGFFPDIGASYFLPRLPFHVGFYLGLTGARITSADCVAIGIASDYVASDSCVELVDAIARTPFESDAKASVSKIISTFSLKPSLSQLLEHTQEIEVCFSKNTIEEILHALESYSSEWSKQTAAIIKTKSPTSLKVTLRALQLGKELNFDVCMQMEFRLASRFLQGHDFYEGVRAAIIDKDQAPRWRPASLAEVNEEEVIKYFAFLKTELE